MNFKNGNPAEIHYKEHPADNFEIGFATFSCNTQDYIGNPIPAQKPVVYYKSRLYDQATESDKLKNIIDANGKTILLPITNIDTFPQHTQYTSHSDCWICSIEASLEHRTDISAVEKPTTTIRTVKLSTAEPNSVDICNGCINEINLLWTALIKNHTDKLTADLI